MRLVLSLKSLWIVQKYKYIGMTGKEIFVYVNTKDMVTVQSIKNVTENGDYFQGTSLLDGNELKLKIFRTDRVIKFFDSIQDAENYIVQGIDSGELYIKKQKKKNSIFALQDLKKKDAQS